MQEEQDRLLSTISQWQADNRELREGLKEQTAAAVKQEQGLSAAAEQACRALTEEHSATVAGLTAAHGRALEVANKELLDSEVSLWQKISISVTPIVNHFK